MRGGTKQSIAPALALLLLSPIVGELLSGSSPPFEFLNPLAFLFMAGLYGSGALIIRELAFRWKKGWVSILIMGAAYGVIEEGLEVKSFFDPAWVDIGALGSYGRYLGVNWVWSVQLTIYHMVFSIAIPILLVTLLYQSEKDRAWVTDRALKILGAVLLLDVIVGFIWLTPYRPSWLLYWLAMMIVLALFVVAYLVPKQPFPPNQSNCPRPRRFFLLGLGFASALFLIAWTSPGWGVPAMVPLSLLLLSCALGFHALLKWSGNGSAWGKKHQLALASGALGFLIMLAFPQDIWGPPNMLGMSLVALAFIVFSVYLWFRVGSDGSIRTPPEFRAQG